MKKFTKTEFQSRKREALLDYSIYQSIFEDRIEGFEIVRKGLSKSEEELAKINPYKLMASTQQRAWDSLEFLLNCFSGGHALDELEGLYPVILEYWKVYLKYWVEFLHWDTSSDSPVAALSLLDTDFVYANQLISFGILLGWGDQLHHVRKIVDLNNFSRDGMLDRLLAPYVSDFSLPPDECTRHLPYFKTLKIFSASPLDRPARMTDYLKDWYQASRREPYYDSHKRGDVFTGYWSWEAAAITYLLDIDDRSYRNAKFYPVDLVDFARTIQASRSGELSAEHHELRAKSGEACPKSGIWQTLDIPLQRRRFTAGEILQAENASYGITVWRYIGD